MSTTFPYLPFFGSDFYDDTRVARMSFEHQGMYVRLLWLQWVNGTLPADPGEIAQLLGFRGPEIPSLPPLLLECFPTLSNGSSHFRANPRLSAERRRVEGEKGAKSRAGKLGRAKQLRAQPGRSPGNIARPVPGHPEPEPELEVNTQIPEDSARSVKAPSKKKDPPSGVVEQKVTWLTPYGTVWQTSFGGQPNWGQLGRALEPVEKELGAAEALRRWTNYCAMTEARFASPTRFAQTHAAYAENPDDKIMDYCLPDEVFTTPLKERLRRAAAKT